ncbi:hypothetical protein CDV36_014561 [Fusarium kuroshium]|uniref:Uncharacterized protein n=1 Tax=Fusarium kuroshium TaxID=2010991 RepID=A0A3M2RHH7_9HYPO|nr:hypothetical protein CDV36_014561 [Fusarium kuroshium]
MNPGSGDASSRDGSSRASSNRSRFSKRTPFVPRETGQGAASGSTQPSGSQPQGSDSAEGDLGTDAPNGTKPADHRPQSDPDRLAEEVRRAREANMRGHGSSGNSKPATDGPNRPEHPEPSSRFTRGHQTPPPATDDVPKRPKYTKPKSQFGSDQWAPPPQASTPEDIPAHTQPDLPQPVDDEPPPWQGLFDPIVSIPKLLYYFLCWLVSYRVLKFIAWSTVIFVAWSWLQNLPGFSSLLSFLKWLFGNVGLGGIIGSRSNTDTEAPPAVFYPPTHGGVLERLSSQSYVLRHAYASIVLAATGDFPVGIPFTLAANTVYATQKHFSKTVRKYDICYRDWQNEAILSSHQLFTLNATLAYCQGLSGERVDLGGFKRLIFTAEPSRRSSCVADLATTALQQGFNYKQDLSRSSECFRQVGRDLDPKPKLQDQIRDLEYQLRQVEPIAEVEDALQPVSDVIESLRMTHLLIMVAKQDLQREKKMIDNSISRYDGTMMNIAAWSDQLKSAIKAEGPDDDKRKGVEVELQEFLKAELSICRARAPSG